MNCLGGETQNRTLLKTVSPAANTLAHRSETYTAIICKVELQRFGILVVFPHLYQGRSMVANNSSPVAVASYSAEL